jgi:predicted alpha/beta-hydrolase family hydrolase
VPETLATPSGPARVHLRPAAGAIGALVLGHGAAGSVSAPDLQAVAGVAHAAGISVALVEQPYLVAGRRSPASAHQLDTAWTAVIEQLKAGPLAGLALVAGGRSSGARVACRTAAQTGAAGVLCLAFPLHAPGKPERTRLDELERVEVPVLVIQGAGDPFGMPPPGPKRAVIEVAGNHALKTDLVTVAAAAREWLARVLR